MLYGSPWRCLAGYRPPRQLCSRASFLFLASPSTIFSRLAGFVVRNHSSFARRPTEIWGHGRRAGGIHCCSAAIKLILARSFSSEAVIDEAAAVIIGGGTVGSSVAYHLAKSGLKKVVILDGGKIGESGATFHPVGFVNTTHGLPRFKRILAYSVNLYSNIEAETGIPVDFMRPGTLRIATSSRRAQEFREYIARDRYLNFDGKTQLITPEEVRMLCPLLMVDKVTAALYTEGNGYINPGSLAKALSIGAKNHGALIYENTQFQKMTLTNDWLWNVETDKGTIKAIHVINAAGLWARDCAMKVGLDLPLALLEHQYAFTGPVAALAARNIGFPAIFDHDNSYYLRPDKKNRFMVGAHEKPDKVSVLKDWSVSGVPRDVRKSYLSSHFDRIEEQYRVACSLIPSLAQTGLEEKHAGAFCMTPDCLPLVGPVQKIPNYWLAAGFFDGVSSAGGIGKFLADWIVEGEPPFELYETDANRFGNWADKKFTLARAQESYSMVYNWTYRDSERPAGRPARVSGLYGALRKEGAQMEFRAGWEVPSYFSVSEEDQMSARARNYQMVTNKSGLIDLAYKGKIEVRGPDAEKFLNYILTNRTPELNKLCETLMLSPKGKIMSRLNVIHHDQHRSQFLLVADPEHEFRDMRVLLRWLEQTAREKKFAVEIHNVSAFLSAIGIVGPQSIAVLSELTLADLSNDVFPFGSTRLVRLAGVPVIAARTSDTGELGCELYHNRADSLKLYAALVKAGEKYGITDFGMKILNTLRIEKGFKRFGTEEDFVGKGSLEEHRSQMKSRKLVMCTLEGCPTGSENEDPLVPRGMEKVSKEGSEEAIGQITSACYSFVLQRPLCFAWLLESVGENENVRY